MSYPHGENRVRWAHAYPRGDQQAWRQVFDEPRYGRTLSSIWSRACSTVLGAADWCAAAVALRGGAEPECGGDNRGCQGEEHRSSEAESDHTRHECPADGAEVSILACACQSALDPDS